MLFNVICSTDHPSTPPSLPFHLSLSLFLFFCCFLLSCNWALIISMPHCDKLVLICCLPPSLTLCPFRSAVWEFRNAVRRQCELHMQADCYETILCLKCDCKRSLGKLEVVVEVCLPILWFLWVIFWFIIKNASYIILKHTLRTHSIVAAARLSVFSLICCCCFVFLLFLVATAIRVE